MRFTFHFSKGLCYQISFALYLTFLYLRFNVLYVMQIPEGCIAFYYAMEHP